MLNRMHRFWFVGLFVIVAFALPGVLWIWYSVPIYPAVQDADFVCSQPSQKPVTDKSGFKVLSFNVQFMAGKNYVFFFDMEGGPDTRPSNDDVGLTLERVAAIIREENPDAVLLQELNDAADVRTHYRDQLEELQRSLAGAAFPCRASAYYWRAGYIPHPKINGPVAMQLVTLSRHPIVAASRYQLPRMPLDPISRHFYFQRALLEVRVDYGGREVALLNTHFDAWADGSGVLPGQVAVVAERLEHWQQLGVPWVVGGDFNMLPPDGGLQLGRIAKSGSGTFDADTAIQLLYDSYGAIPSQVDLMSDSAAAWYTHFPNDTRVQGPDRTIDYLFYSDHWRLMQAYVRHHDTLDVSDHLPVVGVFALRELSEPPLD